MLTEVLKIRPQLDESEANGMEKKLSARFTRIAKGFGRGLKLASVAALGAAVLDKLVNPLQEVKAAIDRTLGKADDIVTNAKQFGSTTENLLKVRALGQVRGLSGDNIDLLLTKFQGAIAEASLNPNNPTTSAVKNFIPKALPIVKSGQTVIPGVNQAEPKPGVPLQREKQDTALAFYNFIIELQKMDKNQQVLVQQQVFGEKQVLKMAEFLQDTGFQDSIASLKKVDFAKAAKATEHNAELNDKMAANRTVNELNDQIKKAQVINNGTIQNVNRSEIGALTRENGKIARSDAAFTAEERIANIQDSLEQLTSEIITNIPIITTALQKAVDLLRDAVDGWKSIFLLLKGSPMVKGIKSLFGGGKDE